MARALTWPDVWRRRLAAHFLDDAAPATRLTDVVGAVCGIHAQIAAGAELSLCVRVVAAQRDQLEHQAQRMAEFYGVPAQIEFGPVEPRGHM